ncbi:MAG: hypothetical protein NTX25_16440, partial [Proteobacteria bacterium]|nr:hypothetical protein [Pseudomonadota bacterium]
MMQPSQKFLIEEIPLQWSSNSGVTRETLRRRAIISFEDGEGCFHEVELAPFPGVHTETLSEASDFWCQFIAPLLAHIKIDPLRWCWDQAWFGQIPGFICPMSSVQTALEQLILSLAQRRRPEFFAQNDAIRLPGSALLSLRNGHEQEAIWQDFLRLWQQGFRVFKCKIGRHDAAEQLSFLQRMQDYGQGELQLRLDANQSLQAHDLGFWQDARFQLSVSYWEEPGVSSQVHFSNQALDESLWYRTPGDTAQAAGVWILKPSRLTLSGTVAWLLAAEKNSRLAVLSNAFDSGLSLRCYAWLYAKFCSRPQALGFGTARYMPADA